MAEQTFFDREGVTVTQARFIVPGQTYTMQGVTSIRHAIEQPSKKWPIVAIVIGAIFIISSLAAFSDSIAGGFVGLLIGLAILVGGIFWLRALKATHIVVLHSASGESRALLSKDAQYITEIVGALNDGIVARG